MNYYIEYITVSKAKADVNRVFEMLGYVNLTPMQKNASSLSRLAMKLFGMMQIALRLRPGDCLCLQYPMKKFYHVACTLAHWRGARVVTIVHDLGAFRRKRVSQAKEIYLFNKTDALIVHNPTMMRYMQEQGFKGILYNLRIFDFITSSNPKVYDTPHSPWRIAYVSNLAHWRNEFVYHLERVMKGWKVVLYGPNYDDAGTSKRGVDYRGKVDEEELIGSIEADFGLVWDGNSFDRCAGDWGEYLRINNPHKTSLYLRAGLPVIIWAEAALAPFILENNLGIAISSLGEIELRLNTMSETEYREMRNNALAMSHKLGEGYYEKNAFLTAVDGALYKLRSGV